MPAGKALFDFAATIGERRIGGLDEKGMGKAQEGSLQLRTLLHGVAQGLDGNALPAPTAA